VVGAIVLESESSAYLTLRTEVGAFVHVKEPMSPDELHDYRGNKEAYFGKVVHVGRNVGNDPYEMFKAFFENQMGMSRNTLLGRLVGFRTPEEFAKWSDEDLLMFYCEGLVRGALAGRTKAA